PFASVNSYGLFAVMTTTRREIVVEGSADGQTWLAYELKWKPGDIRRAPEWRSRLLPRRLLVRQIPIPARYRPRRQLPAHPRLARTPHHRHIPAPAQRPHRSGRVPGRAERPRPALRHPVRVRPDPEFHHRGRSESQRTECRVLGRPNASPSRRQRRRRSARFTRLAHRLVVEPLG
ncbi:MAG: lipase maturation factor family protein, partial [Armatimonadetes bacterium]|nr:lipase maturation factor family protein [Armatimonadota bacterium]